MASPTSATASAAEGSAELCGSHQHVVVHHIRALKDLKTRRQPEWVKTVAARQRKTLVVCRACHAGIHHGRPTRHAPEPINLAVEGCGVQPQTAAPAVP